VTGGLRRSDTDFVKKMRGCGLGLVRLIARRASASGGRVGGCGEISGGKTRVRGSGKS